MPRKSFESSVREKQARKKPRLTTSSRIDFSDIPESTDYELSRASRVNTNGRKKIRKLIALRIDPRLLNKIRRMAQSESKPYQTLIHELLEKAARKVA